MLHIIIICTYIAKKNTICIWKEQLEQLRKVITYMRIASYVLSVNNSLEDLSYTYIVTATA